MAFWRQLKTVMIAIRLMEMDAALYVLFNQVTIAMEQSEVQAVVSYVLQVVLIAVPIQIVHHARQIIY